MERLIDADAMKKELLWGNVYLSDNEINALVDLIDNQPTIDPESLRPVSSWEWNDIDSHWECKRCMSVNLNIPRVKSVNPHVFDGSRYCPHCGAKMED